MNKHIWAALRQCYEQIMSKKKKVYRMIFLVVWHINTYLSAYELRKL